MKILVLVLAVCVSITACDAPGETTGTRADSMVLDPNKTKVQTDTTMFKDSTARRDSIR